VLVAARRVCAEVDALRRLATDMTQGIEAAVSLCIDQLFPLNALVELCRAFATAFPAVDLRVDTQTMSAVSARVLEGTATLGVVSPAGLVPGVERHPLASIRMIPVVAPRHPLARHRGHLSSARLADCVQIVLSERSDGGVPDQAVLSPRTWRVADLHTKHAMLLEGLGWGNLPEHLVRGDLARGRLIPIQPQAWSDEEHILRLSAIYRNSTRFGPAHRWILGQLEQLCARETAPADAAPARRSPPARRQRRRPRP
jgi:DNA-binding transcriptional LysR family regulator